MSRSGSGAGRGVAPSAGSGLALPNRGHCKIGDNEKLNAYAADY